MILGISSTSTVMHGAVADEPDTPQISVPYVISKTRRQQGSKHS